MIDATGVCQPEQGAADEGCVFLDSWQWEQCRGHFQHETVVESQFNRLTQHERWIHRQLRVVEHQKIISLLTRRC